ncbi:MAG: HNH endonuclease [Phycisphaerales bacterium JB054]
MADEDIAAELCLEEGEQLAEDLRCAQCGNSIDLDEGFWTITLPVEEVLSLGSPPPERRGRRIGPRIQAYIRKRDRGACGICGRRLPRDECTAHHIIAFSAGGPTSVENLVVACEDCQQAVGSAQVPIRHVVDTEFVRELSVGEMERITEATHTDAEMEEQIERLRRVIGRGIKR